MRPKLLDLGCGAGAVSMGYSYAGFDVTGVDIVPQPNYPCRFIQADALDFPLEGFDAYHASMPCQRWSPSTLSQRKRGACYPDLVTPVRARLQRTGKPWVMENVPECTPLRADLELCGCHFGLRLEGAGYLKRLRKFQFGWPMEPIRFAHVHRGHAISVAGHGTPAWQRRLTGHVPVASWREVMGISWMTREELTEAIPPVYAQFAGCLLMMRVLREVHT